MLMSKSGYSFWLKRINPEGLNQGQFVPPLPGDTGRCLGTFVVVTPGVPPGIKTWDAAKHPTMHRTDAPKTTSPIVHSAGGGLEDRGLTPLLSKEKDLGLEGP